MNGEVTKRLTVFETKGWALDRAHNSRRPPDLLSALCDTVTLSFDLLNLN